MNCLLILNIFHKDYFNLYSNYDKHYEILENIIQASQDYDITILSNDEHTKEDKEFSYLPPHGIKNSLSYSRDFSFEKKLKSKNFLYLPKTTLTPFSTRHNRELVINHNFNYIYVGGYSGCIDIVPTCSSLIDMKQSVFSSPEIIGDFSEEYKQQAIKFLQILNICK